MTDETSTPGPDHARLYWSLAATVLLTIVLAAVAFRPTPDFPREAPLVETLPPNLDEWRGQ